MYSIRAQGSPSWVQGREGMTLGIGAASAIVAFLIGWFVMRASTLRADDLAREAGPMPAGADKDAKMAVVMQLRGRALMGGRAVATLLLITVIAMAIARYMV